MRGPPDPNRTATGHVVHAHEIEGKRVCPNAKQGRRKHDRQHTGEEEKRRGKKGMKKESL